MQQHQPDLDRRISEIQEQLERLNAVLDLPDKNHQSLEVVETRIWSLTHQFAEILDRWTLADLRHTRAIGEMEARLKDLEALKVRVEFNAEEQLRELQRKVANEWATLQHMLEQPIRQLQEHAASLRQTSVATAGSALSGLERAESRLATIQADLSERMDQLSREVQTTLIEMRGGPARAGQAAGNAASWPLAQVMRLHSELRDTEGDDRHPDNVRRIDAVEHSVEIDRDAGTTGSTPYWRRLAWITAVMALTVGLVVAVVFAVRLQQRFEAASVKIIDAEQQAQSTRAAAERQIAASQQEAARRISQASEAAVKAQMVSDVLAAPDLVRYGLTGGDTAPAARGQLLWSRSRGIVLSASRVPKAPSGSTYQLWLLTPSGATKAGSTDADAEGRLSLATDRVPSVPRPVVGVAVTVETLPGGATPSGPIILGYQRSEAAGSGGAPISSLR